MYKNIFVVVSKSFNDKYEEIIGCYLYEDNAQKLCNNLNIKYPCKEYIYVVNSIDDWYINLIQEDDGVEI